MIGRLLFIFAVLLPATTQSFADEPRMRGADMHCAGLIGGESAVTSIDGGIIVAQGDTRTLSFVTTKGDLQVGRDATVVVSTYTEPFEIRGDVEARNCKSVLLQGNVTVGASLNINSCNGSAWNGTAYQASFVSWPASRNATIVSLSPTGAL